MKDGIFQCKSAVDSQFWCSKSLPGASAALVFTETALKGLFYALWMQKRPSFSPCFICFLGQPLTILWVRAAPKAPVKNKILNLISRKAFVAFQKTESAKNMMNEILSTRFLFQVGKTKAARRRVDLNITLDAALYWTLLLRDSVIHSVWRKPASPRRPGGWSDSSPVGRSRPAEWRSEVGRCVSEWV